MTGFKIEQSQKPVLIVISGPTAVGKTDTGIELAKIFNTEIISADSRQFYKELQIGTAVPMSDEMQGVKHHFIGNLSIHDYYNVSKFENEVLELLKQLFKKNNYAIMLGGSGLYINAVCRGIDELPDADESLREKLNFEFNKNGIEYLRNKLKHLDPDFYTIVDKSNHKRLMRAIEVCLTTGKTYSSLRANEIKSRDFDIIKIGLNRDRPELFDRINNRVDIMIRNGLAEEAKSLFSFRDLNALKTVGYKEFFEYFENKISLEQAITNIKTNTRRYAKRQLTWFKNDDLIKWFHPNETEKIVRIIR
ncbi:MAG: tRNA (adenosine(37)-N6)-dimethylallyltransferase MiaA [Bacteroidales bacterium]|nr:tRNA (adenosine(37)-N6)-dimethylallyltransferase MiaA [Bacteroidales bacterium]